MNCLLNYKTFLSRINVSVQLPALKKAGAKISNWEVMEKVKEMARPFTFPVFKVSKSSLEFIRCLNMCTYTKIYIKTNMVADLKEKLKITVAWKMF